MFDDTELLLFYYSINILHLSEGNDDKLTIKHNLLTKRNMKSMFLPIIITLLLSQVHSSIGCSPYGVRITLGQKFVNQSSDEKLLIFFNTQASCPKSYLELEITPLTIKKVSCDSSQLKIGDFQNYVHSCSIGGGVREAGKFHYSVYGWSGQDQDPRMPYKMSHIEAHLPSKDDEYFDMVVLADWSYLREKSDVLTPLSQSLEYLLRQNMDIDCLYIVGDIAYDLDSNEGRNYRDFLEMISQVTIKWPILITPGNHEHRTPADIEIFQKSFNHYGIYRERKATIHLPWFNLLVFDPYQILYEQEPEDLEIDAFREQLRRSTAQSITITSSHYPFRCNGGAKDCEIKHEKLSQFFEAMLEFNVPVYLGAHYHAYERHFPYGGQGTFLRKFSPFEWKFDEPEENRYMVSIIEGVAGNDESMMPEPDKIDRTFTRASEFGKTGFGILSINNKKLKFTHYVTEQPLFQPFDSFQFNLSRKTHSCPSSETRKIKLQTE